MKASKATMFPVLALLAGMPLAAWGTPQTDAEALREARANLVRYSGQKSSLSTRRTNDRQALNRMIQDIEAGKDVDPAEVDRLLRRVGQ